MVGPEEIDATANRVRPAVERGVAIEAAQLLDRVAGEVDRHLGVAGAAVVRLNAGTEIGDHRSKVVADDHRPRLPLQEPGKGVPHHGSDVS